MTDEGQIVEYLRKVTTELQKTRSRLEEVEARAHEPIAIVGIGCRYPGGVRSPEDLWQLVAEGRDAITELPEDRGWDNANLYDPDPDRTGHSYSREGGFVDDVHGFDAEFFGLSPREAQSMDPQQRLLLETTWESLERAGIDPASVRGTRTGVFTGIMHHDYGSRFQQAPEGFEGYLSSGSAGSIAAGRVSYLFGFEGPAVTVDTACSSSLVALHLACQALRGGECDLALAGGAAVMSTPTFFVEYSRLRVMSTDGRCRSFADDGAGTGWSEGVGVLVVERLSDALRHGHPVLAVVRGSAVNQDGASNGMTAPNGPSQQRVIEAALTNAKVPAAEVDVVEAHGTGTRLGDPIEAQALIATYGRARTADRPLYLGSLKSNIAHTQAAAGVAGVIKMVQAMRHGVLPRSLYADNPTTEVDWSAGTVELLARERPWERAGHARRAGVSSFGMSGTNAHLILEQFEADPGSVSPSDPEFDSAPGSDPDSEEVFPVVLSGRSVAAVRGQAVALGSLLLGCPGLGLGDVAWSLVSSRSVFDCRVVVVGDRGSVVSGLSSVGSSVGVLSGSGSGLGVVFSGQGAQRVGMGRELAARFPVFAGALDELCGVVDPLLGCSLRGVMWEGSGELLERTEFAQPALFVFEVALARLWLSWGVEFSVVGGHSVGEFAAAVVAGVLSVSDAARLVVARGRLMQAMVPGVMVAVEASEGEVSAFVEGVVGVDVAAVNGPRSVVLSGVEGVVVGVGEVWRGRGRRVSRLRVSHGFHSGLMDPMVGEFAGLVEGVVFSEPVVPVVAAAESSHVFWSAGYWVDQVRRAVRFGDVVGGLSGCGVVVELGPDSVLVPLMDGVGVPVVGAVRRGRSEVVSVLSALGVVFSSGVDVDWGVVVGGGRRVELPTYAFQRQNYWLPDQPIGGAGTESLPHPILSGLVELPGAGGILLSGRLSPSADRWLADHAVHDTVLFPGTGVLELALQAARACGAASVSDLVLRVPLVLPPGGCDVQVWVGPSRLAGRELLVRARATGGEWVEHASGMLGEPAPEADQVIAGWATDEWPPAGAERIDVDLLHDDLSARGVAYGPAFRGLGSVWRRDDELFAEVALTDAVRDPRFALHPALLDAALHPLGLHTGAEVQLPFSFGRTILHKAGAHSLRVRLQGSTGSVRLNATTPSGEPVVTVGDLALLPVQARQIRAGRGSRSDPWRYEVTWRPLGRPAHRGPVPGRWLVLADPGADVDLFSDLFEDCRVASTDELPATGHRFAGVLCVADHAETVLSAIRALDDAGFRAPLWCLTRNATAVDGDPSDVDVDVDAAGVWGLGRVAALELPDGWGGLIDLRGPVTSEVTAALAGFLTDTGGEDQVSIGADGTRVRRLRRASPLADLPEWTPAGTVLITGGTGALGRHLARELADRGGCLLLLASRSGPTAPGAAELVAELSATGTPVRVVALDVTDRDAVAELVRSAAERGEPVRSVFHAAGLGTQTPLATTDPAALRTAMAAKAEGARVLDEVLADAELDAFVLFSSISGIWGAAGQAAYAAANAMLDGLAVRRRAHGRTATSLAWGPWSGGGMVDPEVEQQLRRRGLVPMPVDGAIEALGRAVAAGTDAVVVDVRWPEFLPAFTAARPGPLFTEMAPATPDSSADADLVDRRLAQAPAGRRAAVLLDVVRERVAAVVGASDASRIDPDRSFRDLGFDSLMSVELRNQLSAAVGRRLPATLVFDHPTPAAIAALLGTEQDTPRAVARPATPERAYTDAEDGQIAIVGIGCRYPGGVSTPDELWQLLAEGRDAVSGFPTDRGWDLADLYDPDPDRVGHSYTRHGGFVSGVADFDAAFFGISPREALAMDPQHRLLLETSWQAVEHAGIAPLSLRGTRTGVFVGAMYNDYHSRLGGIPDGLEGILGIANSNSVMSGRIAYVLGLEGPAVTVDTACSSSLVALHLACQSLRSGECDLAFAGGATVMASPNTFIEFSRQTGLAPDGRCKPFSADADGTGWSEGVGVLLVERLSDARRAGHEVLAVVRGSAVNSDGASNGLTAPNGPSQQRVIRAALASAGVAASGVDVVEAHGTGTRLGDPIEAEALLATYGQERDGAPLYLGSLKSNIGHTQAAAGVAGVIKMVLGMRHGVLPESLHGQRPSEEIDWSTGSVRLLDRARDWPRDGRPRRAGVSSFGISGTNAHVIVEEGERAGAVPERADEPGPVPVVVSARTEAGARAQAAALAQHLRERPDLAPADVAWSLITTRSTFRHRAVAVGRDRDELVAGLAALGDASAVAPGTVVAGLAGTGRVVLMFPGQGAQWTGMAAELLATSTVFAAAVQECEDALSGLVDWSLTEVLSSQDVTGLPVEVVQPVLFAVMVSLARVWESCGIEVEAVVGHSQGEIAAACVAGALSLPDAARVVVVRSRLLGLLAGTGGMVSVELGVDRLREWLDDVGGRLSIAAVNGPGSVVVSGTDADLDELVRRAGEAGVRVRRIDVDYPSHSAATESVRDALLAGLAGITPRPGRFPLYSTVTGERISGVELDPGYWYRNLRETVRLQDAVQVLVADGFGFFVEAGPHPMLAVGVRQTLDLLGADGVVLGTLRRGAGGWDRMLLSISEGFVRGLPVDWARVLTPGRRVPLPTYAFQRERFWLDADAASPRRPVGRRAGLDSWRYRVGWEPVRVDTGRVPTGAWLVLDTGTAQARRIGRLAAAHGLDVRRVELGGSDTDRAALAARITAAAGDVGEVAGVLSLVGLDPRPHPDLPGLGLGLGLTVCLVQALDDLGVDAPLWVVTAGAVGVDDEAPRRPEQNQLWGLGRVAALEQPRRWGGLVDLPDTADDTADDGTAPDDAAVAALLSVLACADVEDQWAVRPSGNHVRRLLRHDPAPPATPWRPDGTVLITGASGSLGPHLARSVAERGAAHVALLSRRGAGSPGTAELVTEIEATGTAVSVFACDVRDRGSVAAVLDELAAAGHRVVTAIHAAAHLDIEPLSSTTLAGFAEVVHAKVAGAVHLAELLDRTHLRELVLYSSIAGVWGSGEHGAYAAANAFLDAYAERARADGVPVTSIAWGIWDEPITVDRTDADLVVRRGLPFIDRPTAFEGMYQAAAGGEPFLAIADVDWERFVPVFTSARPSPLISGMVAAHTGPAPGSDRAGPDDAGAALRARLAPLSPADRERALLELVQANAAAVLGHGAGVVVAADSAFRTAGFDSLLSVELRNRLTAATGLMLAPTVVFDHADPAELAGHLLDGLFAADLDAAGTVLDRFDRIEADVRSLAADDPRRGQMVDRLEALLAAVGPLDRHGSPDDLESAGSTDELLELLDGRYGDV